MKHDQHGPQQVLRQSNERWLEVCASAVLDGQIAVLPTRRWYMFAGLADNSSVADRIFAFKRRAPSKSLLLVCPTTRWLDDNFTVSDEARQLIDTFLPGELALRLAWRNDATAVVRSVGSPVALTTVADGALGLLAATIGRPLVSTSVNISGAPVQGGTQPCISVAQVLIILAEAQVVSVVVDGGVCPAVDALTVVDCAEDSYLWRPGTLHTDALRHVLPDLDLSRAVSDALPRRPIAALVRRRKVT